MIAEAIMLIGLKLSDINANEAIEFAEQLKKT